ncbi:MAG: hypothetical protein WBA20_00370 [Ketobacter sp.]|jgi:hypothetical protein
MTKAKRTLWHKSRYWLNGLVIIAPVYFLYTSLTPPALQEAWEEQSIGPFTAIPTPANGEPPYLHDGESVKDFSVKFCDGCVEKIRYAYMSVGERPAPIPRGGEGILHGNRVTQHVHAPYPAELNAADKLWVSVQEWNGKIHHGGWSLDTHAAVGQATGKASSADQVVQQ